MLGAYRVRVLVLAITLWALLVAGMWAAQARGQAIRGDVLAFVSDREGNRDIYLLDVAHRITLNMTHDRSFDDAPAWSQDGQLAFESNRIGGAAIIVMNTLTRQRQQVTNNAGNYTPAWSHEGQLAYVTTRGANLEIMVYDFDTGERVDVSSNPGDDMNPAWSPDGRLAFDAYSIDEFSGQILIVNPQTGGERGVRDSEHFYDPAWSPAGELAVVSSRAGSADIYLIDPNTGETVTLVQTPADESQPAWSTAGLLAYVIGYREGVGEIYVMDMVTGETRNVTYNNTHDYAPAWMP